MKIAYQGEEGAYSYIALKKYFGIKSSGVGVPTFKGVFDMVMQEKADCGVLPIENSYAGSVLEVYDLLSVNNLYIVGEQLIKIEHSLLGVKGSKIENICEIFSHEQAFMQCEEYLADFKQVKKTLYFNTAISAKHISELNDVTKGAIASKEAAKLYNLDILKENINTNPNNTTRFIIVSKEKKFPKNAKKASVEFTLAHRQGTLLKVLEYFNRIGLNMVKIESRPTKHTNFEYVFYVDFEGSNISQLKTEDVEGFCKGFRILGVY